MRERGIGFLVFVGQRDPGLDAVQRAAFGARLFESLGMGDAAAGDHPVHFFGLDCLHHAHAVAMHDLAREQVGHRRESDVRMWTHVDGLREAGGEVLRADVIEEDEGADHVPPRVRQHAPDFEASEIATALVDDIHAGWFTRPARQKGSGPFLKRAAPSERLQVLGQIVFLRGAES